MLYIHIILILYNVFINAASYFNMASNAQLFFSYCSQAMSSSWEDFPNYGPVKSSITKAKYRRNQTFAAKSHLVVLTIINDQIVPERSSSQIAFYLDALHSNSSMILRRIFVCLIVDKFTETDEKGVCLHNGLNINCVIWNYNCG